MSSWKNMTLFNYVLEDLPVVYICYKSITPLIPSTLLPLFWILQAISLACYSLKNCGSDRAISISIYSGKQSQWDLF